MVKSFIHWTPHSPRRSVKAGNPGAGREGRETQGRAVLSFIFGDAQSRPMKTCPAL